MKKNIAVIGAHVAVLGAVSLLSGCFTSNPDSGLIGAAARTRGPIKHVHPGKDSQPDVYKTVDYEVGDLDPWRSDDGQDLISTEDLTTSYNPPPAGDDNQPSVEYDTYIVQPGDILSRVAAKFDTRTSTLVELNNLPNADVIYVGQELKVPVGSHSSGGGLTTTSNTSSRNETVQKGDVYVIQPGDTLSEIAVRAGVSIDDLRQLNNISGDMIRAGDKLNIPKGGNVPSGGSSSAQSTNTSVETSTGSNTSTGSENIITGGSGASENDNFAGYRMETTQFYPTDTLDRLADYYGAKKEDILKANHLSDESQITRGMRLLIPVKD
ncbi:MAG: LysM peptidoglycan-binding domain-containing protein [Lentisphaerae bacterium]|nr:LysM peptidoglycan-binding domain-containing protein [Lentisphaerota bacterium]